MYNWFISLLPPIVLDNLFAHKYHVLYKKIYPFILHIRNSKHFCSFKYLFKGKSYDWKYIKFKFYSQFILVIYTNNGTFWWFKTRNGVEWGHCVNHSEHIILVVLKSKIHSVINVNPLFWNLRYWSTIDL